LTIKKRTDYAIRVTGVCMSQRLIFVIIAGIAALSIFSGIGFMMKHAQEIRRLDHTHAEKMKQIELNILLEESRIRAQETKKKSLW